MCIRFKHGTATSNPAPSLPAAYNAEAIHTRPRGITSLPPLPAGERCILLAGRCLRSCTSSQRMAEGVRFRRVCARSGIQSKRFQEGGHLSDNEYGVSQKALRRARVRVKIASTLHAVVSEVARLEVAGATPTRVHAGRVWPLCETPRPPIAAKLIAGLAISPQQPLHSTRSINKMHRVISSAFLSAKVLLRLSADAVHQG